MCLLHREYLLDANDERFGTQLMKTGNWLAYLDAATEAGPQLFLQLCIILRLGYISVCRHSMQDRHNKHGMERREKRVDFSAARSRNFMVGLRWSHKKRESGEEIAIAVKRNNCGIWWTSRRAYVRVRMKGIVQIFSPSLSFHPTSYLPSPSSFLSYFSAK